MKILQLTKKFPYPIKDGETLAIHALSKELVKEGATIHLLAMNTVKHYYNRSDLPNELQHYGEVHHIKVDNRIKISSAFTNLFSQDSYHIQRFYAPTYAQKLADLLQKETYQIIQLETLYLAIYIPIIRQFSKGLIVMRAHNVEQEIWRRISHNTQNPLKRIYLKYLTDKLERFENSQLNQYDILLAITDRDLAFFRKKGFKQLGLTIPIGIDTKAYEVINNSYQGPLSLSFIGSMDWMPNIEGLTWFLEHVWKKNAWDIDLHIAGRNCPPWLMALRQPRTIVHGEVPNAQDFINKHSVMIVPLLSGSGMRAKILEGMALGKVIITTSIGLEGIDALHQKEVFVANNAQEFAHWIQYCYQNPTTIIQVGKNARDLVQRKYRSNAIARKLLQTYEKCIGTHWS